MDGDPGVDAHHVPIEDAIDLHAFDPMRELRVLRLDARAVGHEAIDYPSAMALNSVCVDAATIAHVQPTRWVCVENR